MVVEEVEGTSIAANHFYYATAYQVQRNAIPPDVEIINSLLTDFVCKVSQGAGRTQHVLVVCSSPRMVLNKKTGWRIVHRLMPVLGVEIPAVSSLFALGLTEITVGPKNTLLEEHGVHILSAADMLRASGSGSGVDGGMDAQDDWRRVVVARPNGGDAPDNERDAAWRDRQPVNNEVFGLLQKVDAFVESEVEGGQCQTASQQQARALLAELQLLARYLGEGSPDGYWLALTLVRVVFRDHIQSIGGVQRQGSHAGVLPGGVLDLFVVEGEEGDVRVIAFANPLTKKLVHTTKCEQITSRARRAAGVTSCSWWHALSRWTQVITHSPHPAPQPHNHNQ